MRGAAPSPDEILAAVELSGLRGRGGGWFPAARKWRAVRAEGGAPLVVANGAEGEPGSIKDRALLLSRPGEVVEGLRLAARAVGARQAIVYLKGSFAGPDRQVRAALEEAERSGALRDGPEVAVRRGDDSYVGGEETAVIESLEGRRPWPRPKPPLPSAVGFEGRPTLVQNVETLARVPAAVARGAAFRADERTLVSLWGDVRRPGVYEVPLGTPLRRIVDEHGGGATEDLGMLFPAGPSAAPLGPDQLGLPLDPDALRAAGSALGTAAVLAVGRSACPVALAASLAAFFEREACGQCPPCTMGSANLARIVRALEGGRARGADLSHLDEAAGFMAGHGYCGHGRAGAAAVQGLMRRFPSDVEAHLAGRPCTRRHDCDPFAPGSSERRAMEAVAERLEAEARPAR